MWFVWSCGGERSATESIYSWNLYLKSIIHDAEAYTAPIVRLHIFAHTLLHSSVALLQRYAFLVPSRFHSRQFRVDLCYAVLVVRSLMQYVMADPLIKNHTKGLHTTPHPLLPAIRLVHRSPALCAVCCVLCAGDVRATDGAPTNTELDALLLVLRKIHCAVARLIVLLACMQAPTALVIRWWAVFTGACLPVGSVF